MSDRGTGQGLATVVFVDVEGSTELLHRVGDEAGTASVRSQLDVVRERVRGLRRARGEVAGDGLMLTFASPRQAVSFALASQRALAGSAPRVRFGINTGEVVVADADPFGERGQRGVAYRRPGRGWRSAGVRRGPPTGRHCPGDPLRRPGTVPTEGVRRAVASVGGRGQRGRATRAGDDRAGRPNWRPWRSWCRSTAAGVGQVLLFEGEAGIGKTHLVREATHRHAGPASASSR